jgi:hypothetical protein
MRHDRLPAARARLTRSTSLPVSIAGGWVTASSSRGAGTFKKSPPPTASITGLRDEEAFVERLWLVHDYRKFTYLDPGLPSELVPAHWPGTTAAAVFREYYALLGPKSQRYFIESTKLSS